MVKLLSTFALLVANTAVSILTLPTPGAPRHVVLLGVRVVDGTGAPPLENAVVVIRDARIEAVGSREQIPVPPESEVIDYRGETVMPGLISNHSHVGIVRGTTVGARNYTRDNILRQLHQYETYGVTTVTALGLNGPIFNELRSDVHKARIPGADLLGADRGIGVPNGAPPAQLLPVGEDQLYRPSTPADARSAVREMASRKPDLVKLWLDDFNGSLPVKMKPEIYQAVVDEAHVHGLRVAAHIHDLEDARAIVAAGADIVAHGVRDLPVDEAFIQLLRDRGTWYVPTLALDESTFIYAENPAWGQTPCFLGAVDGRLRTQLTDTAWQQKTRSSPQASEARSALAMNLRNLKRLHSSGVRIGFGTDSGATPLRIPGFAEHRELALMVEAGLPAAEAIVIATSRAAALLGLEDRGALVPGRLADMIVLDGDPTSDIAATTRIVSVWHRGRQVLVPKRFER